MPCAPRFPTRARRRAGLTQVEAADEVGLASRHYQRLEAEHETAPVRRAYLVTLEGLPESA